MRKDVRLRLEGQLTAVVSLIKLNIFQSEPGRSTQGYGPLPIPLIVRSDFHDATGSIAAWQGGRRGFKGDTIRIRVSTLPTTWVLLTQTSRPSTLLQISSFVPESSIASPHTDKPSIDTDDVLASACELANNRSSKILAVRLEQHATLSLEEFVELFKEHWDFVLDTEKLASRMIVALRAVTASQVSLVRSFIRNLC